MANTIISLVLVVTLCVSVGEARRKVYKINGQDGGICKSMVVTQGYACEEHTVRIT